MKSDLNRVLVLGLDGTPYSLLQKRLALRPSSIWHQLLQEGGLVEISSSRPEVSSVAWASYLTGANPGEHGLFGFVDRTLQPFRFYFPNGAHIRRPTLPERVDEAGGTVVSINVPATFPPRKVRGLIVGGFLGVRLENNVHPPGWLQRLQRQGYVIDVDPRGAYRDKQRFLEELKKVLSARLRVALEAAGAFDWDLFQLHIMETDRLYHFFWGEPQFEESFHALLDLVDEAVEQFHTLAKKTGARLVILSDHGFTRARRIFFINAFLRQAGYLSTEGVSGPGKADISPSSRAYALPPARVFLSVRGREPFGGIAPGLEYEKEWDRLADLLRQARDPLDGETVFEAVVRREEIYHGPCVPEASDLLCFPREGIDLKADFNASAIIRTSKHLVGTHTFRDAFFYASGESNDTLGSVNDIAGAGRQVAGYLGVEEGTIPGLRSTQKTSHSTHQG